MSTPLESAVAFALRQLLAAAGRQVTYRRGAQSVSVRMAPGQTMSQVVDESGFLTIVRTQDWIGIASELALGGQPIIPAAGDRIEDAGGLMYEVVPPAGQTEYRPLAVGIDRVRIHTQRIAEE